MSRLVDSRRVARPLAGGQVTLDRTVNVPAFTAPAQMRNAPVPVGPSLDGTTVRSTTCPLAATRSTASVQPAPTSLSAYEKGWLKQLR